MRMFGLHLEAFEMFHPTINKQLEMDYSHADFV